MHTHAECCDEIARLTRETMTSWKVMARGWAPEAAADIIDSAMLDQQVSLAHCLRRWDTSHSDGELILAWANLGALVEGQLKFFLTLYIEDAMRSPKPPKKVSAMRLQPLRDFYRANIWDNNLGFDWDAYVGKVQSRRNAIHAYEQKDIGSWPEWRECVITHLHFIESLSGSLPEFPPTFDC
jgi:hypothetical protein